MSGATFETAHIDDLQRELRANEARREAALKRGADDLQNRLEYVLRERPRALANARREYVAFCLWVYGKIERAVKGAK